MSSDSSSAITRGMDTAGSHPRLAGADRHSLQTLIHANVLELDLNQLAQASSAASALHSSTRTAEIPLRQEKAEKIITAVTI